MSEIEDTWREIPGHAGYFASPDQKVKRAACIIGRHNRKERVLIPSYFPKRPACRSKSNGPYFRMSQGETFRYVPLAELMAATFVREDFHPRSHKILFRDQDPKNCTISNLLVIERH
ncbi:hypothetical protein [Devosia insulae]|uniref:hypothetical protein n=1 Tax=Devosia insulae TaxID=408174 RepID=UPI00114C9F73|nr:hypothetical protein [Devosia insulae]